MDALEQLLRDLRAELIVGVPEHKPRDAHGNSPAEIAHRRREAWLASFEFGAEHPGWHRSDRSAAS
jgi:hypothetical protein